MRSFFRNMMITAVFAAVCLADATADVVPQDWSIGSITLGKTTFADAEKIYGQASVTKVSHDDEADETICYVHSSSEGGQFLQLETGSMGGFKQITGFTVSQAPSKAKCTQTTIDIKALRISHGFHLGQAESDFKSQLPIEFRKIGSDLVYEGETKRMATKQELSIVRSRWPNETQDYFDVTITIKARFENGLLNQLSIHQIESY